MQSRRSGLQHYLLLCLSMVLLGLATACTSLAAPSLKIWSVEEQRVVSFQALMGRAGASDVVLIGESHDNRHHHIVQNMILQAATGPDRKPVLVMEQYDLAQQEQLDAIAGSAMPWAGKADALQALMNDGWDRVGYRPLLETAAREMLPIVAANMSRQALKEISRQGFDVLGTKEVQRLGLIGQWTTRQQAALDQEIFQGHCNALPPAAVKSLSKAQRLRDAVMADKILAYPARPVVAILGRGHVRTDLAVPWYLKRRAPNRSLLTINLDEQIEEASPPGGADAAPDGRYDYVINTPRSAPAIDHCSAFKPSSATRLQ